MNHVVDCIIILYDALLTGSKYNDNTSFIFSFFSKTNTRRRQTICFNFSSYYNIFVLNNMKKKVKKLNNDVSHVFLPGEYDDIVFCVTHVYINSSSFFFHIYIFIRFFFLSERGSKVSSVCTRGTNKRGMVRSRSSLFTNSRACV